VVLAAALVIVAKQPVRAPWWVSADPDGAYVGSSLNILIGNHTTYFDHPGLPTQDALTIAFEGEYLARKAIGQLHDRRALVDEQFLDLDRARPVYRTWAILVYLGSVAIASACCSRLLGHWTWGLAGGLLLLAAPGIARTSVSLRPDSALAGLCVAIGFLVVTAYARRSAARYAGAAGLLGLAMTVKLAAIGLIPSLVLAAAQRPPVRGWQRELARTTARMLRRRRLWLVPAGAAWIELCVVFNHDRLPVITNLDQRHLLAYGGTFLGGFIACTAIAEAARIPLASRLFSSFHTLLLVAFSAGLALPGTLLLDDGTQALAAMWHSLAAGRASGDTEPLSSFSWSSFDRYPLHQAGMLFALALLAAGVRAWKRDYGPALLTVAMVALATIAVSRYSRDSSFAPAYAVAIPAALLGLRRDRDRVVPLHAWLVVALIVVPTFRHLHRPTSSATQVDAAAQRLADRLLKPGEVILAPPRFPVEDVRFDGLVDDLVDEVPGVYPYRFLEAGSARVAERHLIPGYYVDTRTVIDGLRSGEAVRLAGGATYRLRPLPIRWGPGSNFGVAEILAQ
jgi:hypothetical protein